MEWTAAIFMPKASGDVDCDEARLGVSSRGFLLMSSLMGAANPFPACLAVKVWDGT